MSLNALTESCWAGGQAGLQMSAEAPRATTLQTNSVRSGTVRTGRLAGAVLTALKAFLGTGRFLAEVFGAGL